MEVIFDEEYLTSWDGVMQYAELQRMAKDDKASDVDKFVCLAEYYSKAVKNLDEIKESLGGGNAPATAVFEFISQAMQPKN